jgi:transketolase
MRFELGPRRGLFVNVLDLPGAAAEPLSKEELDGFETLDLVYRCTCALLYNYVPTSGHPGGSISSGRFVAGLLFDVMDYDLAQPDREDADIISYAAGHKAMGLYTMWALRNEIARLAAPELLPQDERRQLRLEDLLGFRRNPATRTPLVDRLAAKALDGHPTPATPFVRLATGASGVGVASSLGLALGALDTYGDRAPLVHVVEGEGGLTPGRVAEAMAAAASASIGNVVMHVDWNQASIDSEHVCRDGAVPGDYVQWTPAELAYVNDWNVIEVPDGRDFQQIATAQRLARSARSGQPTMIVYRTVKGWKYGIEGRASHGAGHKLCSAGFYSALAPLLSETAESLPSCEPGASRCSQGADAGVLEECFWEALQIVRRALESRPAAVELLATRLLMARERLEEQRRRPHAGAPRLDALFDAARHDAPEAPAGLRLKPGTVTTLRGELGRALQHLNRASGGAVIAAAADLLGSTSIAAAAEGFGSGFFNARSNPASRTLAVGGICEDAMAGILSGLAAFGRHLGAGSSYGAFLAPLGHIAARLHAIGSQARRMQAPDEPFRPFVLVCAHAGLKTGEDGPTHADPQALQLLQDNFPPGTMTTLTPWDPQELWPLLCTALAARPAVIAPFVTRPNETVLDREALGLAPATDAAQGVYRLRRAHGQRDGTVVLQESGVTYAFVTEALPLLEAQGVDLDVFYVASSELFERLPADERESIFPEEQALEAMGITGFTLPTMLRWVTSRRGREATLHPFRKGHFLGSGQASAVLAEAGLDGASQAEAVLRYLEPV